jgi:hypothetical protein
LIHDRKAARLSPPRALDATGDLTEAEGIDLREEPAEPGFAATNFAELLLPVLELRRALCTAIEERESV